MSAGKSGVKLKKFIYPASLVKRRAAWNCNGFYTGSRTKDIDLTAEALRARREEFVINETSDLCELPVSAVRKNSDIDRGARGKSDEHDHEHDDRARYESG
jgi:hypothetical protein